MPQSYLATNWPIRYSSLSSDGRLIAVAGRRGLIHYSSTSGRWKTFADAVQEQAFSVRGGLLWFHHVLIAAVEVSKSYQVCFFFVSYPMHAYSSSRFACIPEILNWVVTTYCIAKLSHHPSSLCHWLTTLYLFTLLTILCTTT